MMSKFSLLPWLMAVLLMASGCARQEMVQQSNDARVIKFAATLADDDAEKPQNRIGLVENGAIKSLVARWREGDRVTLYVNQGKYFAGKEVTVRGISPDGKQCTFDLELPQGVDPAKSMVILGVCGTTSRIMDNALYVQVSPANAPIDKAKAVIYFRQQVSGGNADVVPIRFKHLGAYEVIHIMNRVASPVQIQNPMLRGRSQWYHLRGSNETFMDLDSHKLRYDNAAASLIYTSEIAAGATRTFVNWYVPNGKPMAGAAIHARIGDKDVVSTSSKSTSAALKEGMAYHVYAAWDGKSLTLTDADGVGVYKLPLMVTKSSVRVKKGETVLLGITSGNGSYTATMSNGNASATIKGSDVYIKGISQGEANLTIQDALSKEKVVVKVLIYVAQSHSVGIEWVDIPAGSFMMGSPDGVGDDDEHPQHKITLSAFRMSKYEVTFDQYDAFCEATGRSKPSDYGWGRGNRPVINVSWYDARAFCDWLGNGTRLPTEAEWEYACRAGTTTTYSFGNEINANDANYGNRMGQTIPVGQYAPNKWGLYDMHGNVWEWCEDWYHADYYKYSPAKDPKGLPSGSGRVVRGGSWYYDPQLCRSAERYSNDPSSSYYYYGFRVVASSLK